MNWQMCALILAVLVIALAGCTSKPLIVDVSVSPDTISPNADGDTDVAEIRYHVTRQASLSIYFVDETGQEHYFRRDVRRSPGPRTAYFGGAIDGALLADGRYTCVIEATDSRGHTDRAEEQILIRGGDPVPLRIEGMSVYPSSFTPNRDGVSDRVRIAYTLNKAVAFVEVYLTDEEGNKYPVAEDEIREAGAAGNHEHDYDAGVDRGAAPPADGTYTVVVEAEDFVGNRSVAKDSLAIELGGVPLAEIFRGAVRWSSDIVVLGNTVTFTCTVRNVGKTPIRTKGPEPGYRYATSQNYNTQGYHKESGTFRVGLDFEGASTAGRRYPWRWQLGRDAELTMIGDHKYLMPGQSVTVMGSLAVEDAPVKTEPVFWVGLLHEDVWVVQDYVDPHPISVEY